MASSLNEYLKKYTGKKSKTKIRKENDGGLIIIDDMKLMKEDLNRIKTDNKLLMESNKMEIKNGIDAINETKKNYELAMRSKYSRSNFISLGGENNETEFQDNLEIERNMLQKPKEEPIMFV